MSDCDPTGNVCTLEEGHAGECLSLSALKAQLTELRNFVIQLRERAEKAERELRGLADIRDTLREVCEERDRARAQAFEEAAEIARSLYDPGQQPEHDVAHDVALSIEAKANGQ